jgi:ABC-type sulfate transport system substrate-binding protein
MLYIVESTYTQYFVDEVEADSPEEAKAILEGYDIDELTYNSATFEITDVREDE